MCRQWLVEHPTDVSTTELLAMTRFRVALHLEMRSARPRERDAAFSEALGLLRTAEELAGTSRSLDVQQALSYSLLALGKLDEAGERLDRVIAAVPGQAMPHRLRAMVRLRTGAFEDAETDLARAQQLDPRDVRTRFLRARALSLLGRLEEAHAILVDAGGIATPAQRFELLRQQQRMSHDLGDHERALAEVEQALALAPDHAGAHVDRGVLLYEVGRLDEADAELAGALSAEGPSNPQRAEALHYRGLVAQHAGRHAEARDLFESALAIQPRRADTLQALVASLRRLGEREQAREVASLFREVVEADDRAGRLENKLLLQPEDLAARVELVGLLLTLQRLDEAAEHLASVRRAQPDHPKLAELEAALAQAR